MSEEKKTTVEEKPGEKTTTTEKHTEGKPEVKTTEKTVEKHD